MAATIPSCCQMTGSAEFYTGFWQGPEPAKRQAAWKLQLEDKMEAKGDLRYDFQVIESWIRPGSKVLGLGCGDGTLLHSLKKKKNIRETGIDIKESNVAECIGKGLTVIQGDINTEINDYPDAFFDTVVLSQTLQETYEPIRLLKEILRIGKTAVVSFPNFSHWKIRMQFLFKGAAPVTEQLPYTWYDTPNIRVLSINDFKSLSKSRVQDRQGGGHPTSRRRQWKDRSISSECKGHLWDFPLGINAPGHVTFQTQPATIPFEGTIWQVAILVLGISSSESESVSA
jgi:methionine biosynthesis protein MetW